jgi:ACR3 family arsenite transporter
MSSRAGALKSRTLVEQKLHIWAFAAMAAGLAIGSLFPFLAELRAVITYLLILVLLPTMMNLRLEWFLRSLLNARLLASAGIISYAISPLLGALLANIFFSDSDSFLRVGFIIITTMPCGIMTVAWTGYAAGRAESALVVFGFILTLSVVMVPFWVSLLSRLYVTVDIWPVAGNLIIILICPLVIGLVLRSWVLKRYGEDKLTRLMGLLPALSAWGLISILFCMMAVYSTTILSSSEQVLRVLAGLIVFYPVIFFSALFFSKLNHIVYEDAIALGFVVTSRNMVLSMAVAATAFPDSIAILPASFGPLIQIPTMVLIVKLSPAIAALFRKTLPFRH